MKPSRFLSIICLSTVFICFGCGRSEERWRLLRPLEKELSQLQEQVPPLISELSRARMEIRSIRNRDDLSPTQNREVDSAHQQVAAAFNLIGDWKSTGQENLDGVIKAYEFNIDLLKKFISQSSAAIKESHEVIDAIEKQLAQTKESTKK